MRRLGSKTPVVILSHRDCELYCCHLDGYKGSTEALLARLGEIEAVFNLKAPASRFRVWYNLDENHLERPVMEQIARSIAGLEEHILKIAFIGLGGLRKYRFNRALKKSLGKKELPVSYFRDAEKAKDWLV